MAVKKLYDLAVVTGSYESQGQTKNRYKNVGAVLQKDDGSKFITLDRSFNPAGVPFRDGSDTILLSMFTPKDDANKGGQQQAPQQRQAAPAPAPRAATGGMDDDIPF
jgi:hypothetical protein